MITVVLVLVGGAVYLNETAPSRAGPQVAAAAATTAAVVQGPIVPGADALSTAWYCAEGTSSADGRADETVIVVESLGRAHRRDGHRDERLRSAGRHPEAARRHARPGPGPHRRHDRDRGPRRRRRGVRRSGGRRARADRAQRRRDRPVRTSGLARLVLRRRYHRARRDRSARAVQPLRRRRHRRHLVPHRLRRAGARGLPGPRRAARTTRLVPVSNEVRRQDHVATFVRARTGRVVAERTSSSTGRRRASGSPCRWVRRHPPPVDAAVRRLGSGLARRRDRELRHRCRRRSRSTCWSRERGRASRRRSVSRAGPSSPSTSGARCPRAPTTP